jgi:hypothetical protein
MWNPTQNKKIVPVKTQSINRIAYERKFEMNENILTCTPQETNSIENAEKRTDMNEYEKRLKLIKKCFLKEGVKTFKSQFNLSLLILSEIDNKICEITQESLAEPLDSKVSRIGNLVRKMKKEGLVRTYREMSTINTMDISELIKHMEIKYNV